jgi:hypothetical protein
MGLLRMKPDDHLRQAELCDAEARKRPVGALRRQFELLARQWRDFATRTELVEKCRAKTAGAQRGHA